MSENDKYTSLQGDPRYSAPESIMVKAWRVHLKCSGWVWLDKAIDVVNECDGEDYRDPTEGPAPRFTLAEITAMQPGDSVESGEWTVECQMVSKQWLDSLPEHTGW